MTKIDCSQGRERKPKALRPAVRADGDGILASQVAQTASAIGGRIAVQDLAPESRLRSTNAVAEPWHRREVAHHQQSSTLWCRVFAQEAKHSRIGIVTVDPFKSRGLIVLGVKRRFAPVQPIEINHPSLQPLMSRVLQEVPIKAPVVRPFCSLPEFRSIKRSFLPGWAYM